MRAKFIQFLASGFVIASVCFAGLNSATHLGASEPGVQSETQWSLQPLVRPAIPSLPSSKWKARNPIDPFIFQKLAQSKLSPSPEAARPTLIRRLYFDLVGLPPSPDEVDNFEKDKSPDAYEKIVERLLASPRYGERWGQHWLDVVRFAETHGFEMNQPRPTAWRYRDYVINAFNEDKPYDQFIREQLAGDLFGEDPATGFLVAGPWDQVKSPDPVLTAAQRADELHDMVSTVGSAFLGLTVGCARCHNHKFDPIPQVDYYAIKACLAGVEHGERKLQTPDLAAKEEQAEVCRKQLSAIEASLTQFEPLASTSKIVLLEPEPAFGSKTIQLLKKAAKVNYSPGKGRGEREDPGDVSRLPNLSKSYLAWSNSANETVLSVRPGIDGHFRLWLSWGCGSESHAKDAAFILDADGDPTTTNDQTQIAVVDERHFADGTGELANKKLWSGFYDVGVWHLASSNRIFLVAGPADATVTAGTLALVEDSSLSSVDQQRIEANSSTDLLSIKNQKSKIKNFLRPSVNARRNVERFAPVATKSVRFSIARTTDAEPCIDELEIYTAGANPTNVALAGAGAKAKASSVFPNSDIHRLEHLNDGKYGNSRSWISNEREKSWVELEFPNEVTIDRVIWGRDREQQFSDRLALDYRIEVLTGSNEWRLAASSQDRLPYLGDRPAGSDFSDAGLAEAEATKLKELLAQRKELEERVKELSAAPMVYAGKMTNPEPTFRLQRGDPMQKREAIEPAGLSAIPVEFSVGAATPVANKTATGGAGAPTSTEEQRRRLALANWIANPRNPLPARVIVNRLWQYHFGEGLVSTPSDFGKKGSPPTHPELLDWLASELIAPSAPSNPARKDERRTSTTEPNAKSTSACAQPWSLKHIHRLIVTSGAYRQSTVSREECTAADAGCRLLWRYPPQRLEAEQLRDAILAITRELALGAGGPGFSVFETNDNYVRVYNPKKEFGPLEWRRMIYMTKVRMQQDATFGAFDCPDGGQITPKRMHSTTPLQALNLLNSDFIVQQAGLFATRLEAEAGQNIEEQVRLAFRLAYSRNPEKEETRAAQALVAKHGLAMFCRAIFNSNEFLFLE